MPNFWRVRGKVISQGPLLPYYDSGHRLLSSSTGQEQQTMFYLDTGSPQYLMYYYKQDTALAVTGYTVVAAVP